MTRDIYQAAVTILNKHYQAEKVRKVSLYLTKFAESDYQQLNLFENDLKRSEINQLLNL